MVKFLTMLKVDAFAHFGSPANTARALAISDAAVSKWDDVVPLESALALETLTRGKVTVDYRLYPKLARARKLVGEPRRRAGRH